MPLLQEDGTTPLIEAVEEDGCVRVIVALLKAGSGLDVADKVGPSICLYCHSLYCTISRLISSLLARVARSNCVASSKSKARFDHAIAAGRGSPISSCMLTQSSVFTVV